MTYVFEPWVGGQYDSIESERIFILGESHYEEGESSPGFTKAVVAQHAHGSWRHGFYTKIAQIVEGRAAGEIDQKAFWEKVAFVNFVQSGLHEPRSRPTTEQWKSGLPALRAYLETLRPDILLVLGAEAWDWIPRTSGRYLFSEPLSTAKEVSHPFVFTLPDGHIVLSDYVHHPSSFGFNWSAWAPRVNTLRKLNSAVRSALNQSAASNPG